jgi:hypothetical protein
MNALPLRELQQNIYALVAQNSVDQSLAAENLIEGTSPLTPSFRLAIYANAYLSRIAEVLASDFRTVRQILGEDIFLDLVADYISARPPQSPNISEVGRRFSEFISQHPFGIEVEYLTETAALEWLVHAAHYAALSAEFDFSKLASFSEDHWLRAQFELTSSLQILDCKWPVDDLWVVRNSNSFAATEESLHPTPGHIAIYRTVNGVFVDKLTAAQAHTLRLMAQRKNLSEISESLTEMRVEVPAIMSWFSTWAKNKIITNVEVI